MNLSFIQHLEDSKRVITDDYFRL